MWNESSSSIQVYIQQWFHDEQGANFIVTRNNYGHVLMGDLVHSLKYEVFKEELNNFSSEAATRSVL